MIPRSVRAKEAFKTGLAMAIAYGIALSMDWDRPYWAGFAVAMISLGTAGQSLNKAAMRMLGTLVAVVAALTFIALFPQERWSFLAIVSVYVGFCTYMMTGPRYQYFWQVSAFVCLIIATDGGVVATGAFDTAIERAQETGLGILVYSLIGALLWPRGSVGELDHASRELAATQGSLFRSYRDLLTGRGSVGSSGGLRMREVQIRARVAQLVSAAQTESYQVWELRRQWRCHLELATMLGTTLERWRESFPEVTRLDLGAILPDLDAILVELERRFEQIERMLGGKAPDDDPKPITISVDRSRLRDLSHFRTAAVAVTRSQLERLERVSRSLVACVRDLKGFGPPALLAEQEAPGRREVVFDPDRFEAAVRVVATLWIAFLLWVYVNPPGHVGIVQLAPSLALAAATMPQLPVASLLLPFAAGTAFTGVLYVFVMPHLTGYGELGAMIFLATFAIYFLFAEPRHALAKMGAIVPFVVLISVQNEQTYSFAGYANSAAMIMLGVALVIATTYIPSSPRPEKVFVRLLRRFFRHAEFLMARLGLDWEEQKGLRRRWQTRLYGTGLLTLADELETWGRQIDRRILTNGAAEPVQAVVDRLRAIAYRLDGLVEVRGRPQAEVLVQELVGDVRPWRLAIQKRFERWGSTPEADPGDVRTGLLETLARLERRVDETFERVGSGRLSAVDYENLYRLLGAYRGLSEAVVEYARVARDVDWAGWQEPRF